MSIFGTGSSHRGGGGIFHFGIFNENELQERLQQGNLSAFLMKMSKMSSKKSQYT